MPMLVSGLVVGLLLGLATGGHWRNLQRFDLKLWPALVAGVVARNVAPFLDGLALTTSVAGLLLVALVALVNRVLPGAWLIAIVLIGGLFAVLGAIVSGVWAIQNGLDRLNGSRAESRHARSDNNQRHRVRYQQNRNSQ